MPYDFLNTIKDNLKYDIDLDLSSFKRRAELNYNIITPNK